MNNLLLPMSEDQSTISVLYARTNFDHFGRELNRTSSKPKYSRYLEGTRIHGLQTRYIYTCMSITSRHRKHKFTIALRKY
jgi:hypothetical protein